MDDKTPQPPECPAARYCPFGPRRDGYRCLLVARQQTPAGTAVGCALQLLVVAMLRESSSVIQLPERRIPHL